MCEFQQQCHVVLCMLVQVQVVWGQRQIKLALHKDKKQCHYHKQGTHMQHKCISHTYYHYRDGGSKQASSGCKVDLSLFYHSIDVLVSYEIYFPVYIRPSVHIQRPDQQTRIICIVQQTLNIILCIKKCILVMHLNVILHLITHKPNHTNVRHMKKGKLELFTSPER